MWLGGGPTVVRAIGMNRSHVRLPAPLHFRAANLGKSFTHVSVIIKQYNLGSDYVQKVVTVGLASQWTCISLYKQLFTTYEMTTFEWSLGLLTPPPDSHGRAFNMSNERH